MSTPVRTVAAPAVPGRARAALVTVFALAAALAVCVVMMFWTPLEAPASWRAGEQTTITHWRP